MSSIDFFEQLKRSNSPASIYFLYGAESFLIERAKEQIIKKVLKEEELEFNVSQFDLEDTPVQVAVTDCETLPFFGDYRVVIMKNPIFLTANKDKTKVEHDPKTLEAYIASPNPQTVLIVVAPYEKLDERKKLVKTFKKSATVLEAAMMDERTLIQWIVQMAHKQHRQMTEAVAEQLIALTGKNLSLIHKEMEKLLLASHDEEAITEVHLETFVPRTMEDNIFALINEIANRNIGKAFFILKDLYIQKEEPIKILMLIARQVRIIYHVMGLTTKGYSQKQMAQMLKIPPFAVKLAMGQGKKFSIIELETILGLCAQYDYEIKSGKIDKFLAIELLLAQSAKTSK